MCLSYLRMLLIICGSVTYSVSCYAVCVTITLVYAHMCNGIANVNINVLFDTLRAGTVCLSNICML